jgi:hypothetical protein
VNAPERIWAWAHKIRDWETAWDVDDEEAPSHAVQYIRADIHEAEVARLREAFDAILHVGHDAPATFAGDEADWQARRARHMQYIARAALGDDA